MNGSATRSRNRATAPGSSGAIRSSAPSNAVRTSNCSSSNSRSAGAKAGVPSDPSASVRIVRASRATTSGSTSVPFTPNSRATRSSCTVRATGRPPPAPLSSSVRISGPSTPAIASPSGPTNASRRGSSSEPLPPRTASVTSIAASGAVTEAGHRPSSAPNSRPTASNSEPVRSSIPGDVSASTNWPVRFASTAYGRSAAQPAAAARSSGPSATPEHRAITANGPAANGSPGSPRASSNSSGARLRHTRAAVRAHASAVPSTGGRSAHTWTRSPASRAAAASSGGAPTTRSAELPGRRVYVVNVSRSTLPLGRVTAASPSQRATSALCLSTRTTGPPAGASSSLARRRSARTAASHGPRDTAKSSSPSRTGAGPGGSRPSGSDSAPPPTGVADTQCGERHASTGSRSPGSGTPGGRCTACVWNRTGAVPSPRAGAVRPTTRLPSDSTAYVNACGSERSSASAGRCEAPSGSA
ncbi:hypothetical protein SCYAM73S_01768 [Streptomyces cyaneofuscatus]